jgi:dTDP-4-amino-4,6-dideoxygalactose transaminase
MLPERINVTKSFLPPLSEYTAYLEKIWQSGQLTNQGPLLQQLEKELKDYLNVSNVHFVANGTLALQLAIRALDISEGEIITTPFSYVATTSSILWEHSKPVFVDIKADTLCIDEEKIENAITEKTKAIMAVHVFGYPCNVEAIEKIATKNNIKVIYDAAHAFGVEYKNKSLLDYGDISTLSFHATKLFHTIEGGAVVTPHSALSDKVELLKRFGHNYDEHIMLGINAKANEIQAAMGLANLQYIDEIIDSRQNAANKYNALLKAELIKPKYNDDNVKYNYAYYPVIFGSEKKMLSVKSKLEEINVFTRRYFYPSLNQLPYITNSEACELSEDISGRILCLPLYSGLEDEAIEAIAGVVNSEA